MNKRTKLQKILQVLDPSAGTKVDFTELDTQINKLKEALKEKIQVTTLDDVNSQLEKFQKKIDFKPLQEAMVNLESSLDLKIKGISGLLSNEVSALKKLQVSHEENASEKISTIASNIEVLKQEQAFLNDQKATIIAELKDRVSKLDEFSKKANSSYVEIQGKITDLQQQLDEHEVEDEKEIKELTDKLEKLRKELNTRISNIGGGAMNRQNFINNADPLTRYTDINWKAGSNVTITYANNDQTKRVDITLAATGGPGGTTRSINSISTPTTAGSTAGTDYVYLVSGTTTLTLPTAVANTNLYTVKNVGTGVVTIDTTGGQTIDGNATITMATQFTSVDLISDTANWNIT